MSAVEAAGQLLQLAHRDRRVLVAALRLEADAIPDEAFGFFAQQAVEKALKAWLELRRVRYPLTHKLRESGAS